MQLDLLVEKFQKKNATTFEKLHGMYTDNICRVINPIVKNEYDYRYVTLYILQIRDMKLIEF